MTKKSDLKIVAWQNPSGGIHPVVLNYQKEDMRPERAAEYSVALVRLDDVESDEKVQR